MIFWSSSVVFKLKKALEETNKEKNHALEANAQSVTKKTNLKVDVKKYKNKDVS